MAAEAGPPEPVFVEHFEQRRPVGKNAKKLPASNFYLRDSLGRQHLAGQADAHGDAHYTYHNTKAFGARYGEVSCHNKKEMISYLDRIIQTSQERARAAQASAVAGPAGPVPPQHATTDLPRFMSHRHEKSQGSSGQRINKWYLVDAAGAERLAVVGHERETRDGHYSYRAQPPFDSLQPLESSNMAGVVDYLQRIITVGLPPAAAGMNPFEATAAAATDWDSDAVYHDARSDMDSQPRPPDSGLQAESAPAPPVVAPAAAAAAAARPGPAAAAVDSVPPTPPPSTAVMPAVAIAPAGTAVLPPSRPATSAALHTPSVSGKMALTPTHSHGSVQEPYQHKRTKASGAAAELRSGNMTAKEAVYAALRRRADAEAAARAVDKRRALDFVRAPVEPGDLRQLRALLAALAQTLAALEQLPNGAAAHGAVPMEVDGQPNGIADHGPAGGASEPGAARLKHVTAAMDLLRELGSVHLSLRLMAASDVVVSLAACARHMDKSVAEVAGMALARVQRTMAHYVAVLTDPEYLANSRAVLEAKLPLLTQQAEETASAAYNAAAPPVPQPRLMPVARSTPNLLAAAAAGAAGAAKTISQPVAARATASGISAGMPETGTHSAATGPIVNSPAVGEVSSPIRPDTRLALPRLPAPQATPVWAGAAVRAGAGTPGAAAASGAASAARPAQGPIFVSEPQHGPTAGGLGSSGRGPASPVLVPTGKRSKPAQGTERRRPDGPFIPALTGPPLPVSSPLQPPAQGSGSFSPARMRQSPLKFRQSPMMAGDVTVPAGTAAPAPVPLEQLPVPTKAKRTLNRMPKGRGALADDSQAEQPGAVHGQDGSQSAAADMDADSDEERWHDSDGEEQELTIDSSESPLANGISLLRRGKGRLQASRFSQTIHIVRTFLQAFLRQMQQVPNAMTASLKEQTTELLMTANQLSAARLAAENRELKRAVVQKVADILASVEALQ